jgi:hypothetical protein
VLLDSKVVQQEVARTADPSLSFDSVALDTAEALHELLRVSTETMVLRPEFSPRQGSAFICRPEGGIPAEELAALWNGGRVLAHRWVAGVPHFANGVVFDGALLLTDCWRCFVLDDDFRCLLTSVINVARDAPAWAAIAAGLSGVVAAAGLRDGPVHVELLLTGTPGGEAGIKIVKIAPRLAGEPLRTLCHELGIVGQADAVSARRPADISQPAPASIGFIADYSFVTRRYGRLIAIDRLDEIRSRPSYRADLIMPKPGDMLQRPTSGEETAASVLLRGWDEAAMLADIAYYQRRNADDIFLLET